MADGEMPSYEYLLKLATEQARKICAQAKEIQRLAEEVKRQRRS